MLVVLLVVDAQNLDSWSWLSTVMSWNGYTSDLLAGMGGPVDTTSGERRSVSVTANGEIMRHSEVPTDEWARLAGDDWCDWWNGSLTYDTGFCNHFTISRMQQTVVDRSVERAIRCAAHYETECVLSFEIGLSIPSCFFYDRSVGMRMITAPRILSGEDEVTVRADDPTQSSFVGHMHKFNRTIQVEFLPGGSRRPATETLHNSSAWCVQLLRAGISPGCWATLD
tara:strand:+ start:35 stop:709 length:675 start_codon:yes stop_codon:yes gene_type:complete